MFKGARARERVFTGLMWLVSIVLAGFLIGLGSLVIGDLPRVETPVQIEQFMDPGRAAAIEAERDKVGRATAAAEVRLAAADEALGRSQSAYGSAKETFDNWIATRSATGDRTQDPEVVARTRGLDALKTAEQAARAQRDAIQTERDGLARQGDANREAAANLREAALPAFEQAKFVQELKVFALRLALTLPLLAISAWMLLRKPRGDYWPMKRGFILFSAFAFFVELVPYLPEYGGYIRYGVGIVLTLIVGHYVIKGMRAYLKAREADETRAEPERVRAIEYEQAIKKMASRACPGCERPLPVVEGAQIDYCVHCGMHLFNRCGACATRKFAFFRYCMSCGTPAAAEAVAPTEAGAKA